HFIRCSGSTVTVLPQLTVLGRSLFTVMSFLKTEVICPQTLTASGTRYEYRPLRFSPASDSRGLHPPHAIPYFPRTRPLRQVILPRAAQHTYNSFSVQKTNAFLE